MTDFDGVEWELVRLVQEKREAEKAARVAFKKELARNLRVPWRKANPPAKPKLTPIAKQRKYYAKARKRVHETKLLEAGLSEFTARQIKLGEQIVARLISEGKMK